MKQKHSRILHRIFPFLLAAVIFMGSLTMISGENKDILIKAMKDELNRSMTSLKIENMEKPYYLEYSIWDHWQWDIEGNFGSLTKSEEDHQRLLKIGVRVGSYQLDNTGFFDRGSIFSSLMGNSKVMFVDDDYHAIRHGLWLGTDRVFKQALQHLANKKALLKNQAQTEETPDFSREESVQLEMPCIPLAVDREKWENIVKNLSAIFRQFPALHESQVKMQVRLLHKYFVNSEGTVFIQPETLISLVANASTQASDGMKLKHYIPFYALSFKEMPAEKELAAGVKKMAEELTALASAPVLESYIGPVLFTQQAAGELFTQALVPHLSGQRPPLSNFPLESSQMASFSQLVQRLNRNVLPREISITDDPTLKNFNNIPLIGCYSIDDQGVLSKKVNLVEKGNLKTLLMSRQPRKEILKSNGHARASLQGNPEVRIGNLLITTDNGKTNQQLKNELLKMCREQQLPFGLMVKTLDNPAITGMEQSGNMKSGDNTGTAITSPVMMYRVYVKDGREELVRGISISKLTLRDIKEVAAVGKDYYVLNRMMASGSDDMDAFYIYLFKIKKDMGIPATIVAPSLLFEEVEFKRSEEKPEKPPLLSHPFFLR